MRILFLSHKFYPDIGGIEGNSEILATEFTQAGHNVRLLTWSEDKAEKKFPFTVIRKPTIKQIFKEHRRADLIFENNPCLRLSWPAIFFSHVSVIVLNTWLLKTNGKTGIAEYLKLFWLRRAKKVIAVSEAVRKKCWTSAIVINNPYQADNFKIIQDAARTNNFVFLGRLVSDKGADQAIQAIYQLHKKNNFHKIDSKPRLTIIGDGPEKNNLKQLVSDLGLENYIHFTGFLSGITLVTVLNRHKYLLVPSVWEEPFGNVVLEGLACGCLPIVSNGGGLPDAIGNAGLTFTRGNVDDLVQIIQKILQDSVFEEKIRDNADSHLAKHHPAVVAKRYLEIINAVANKNK